MADQKSDNALESYPLKLVLLSNAVSIAIYLIGVYVLAKASILLATALIVFIIVLEVRVLQKSCKYCYYYGKTCCFGKGKICALFFKKEKRKFSDVKISWKDILPDFLVFLIPLFVGIYLLIVRFSVFLLALLVLLVLLSFFGNAFVRGNFACKYCKQRSLGCPAEKFFQRQKTQK